ncbi:hypothetical protein PV325_005468, partial [Microctonus aethiopoides]
IIIFTALLALTYADVSKRDNDDNTKTIDTKKDKRGLYGLGYGYALDSELSLPTSYASYSSYPTLSHGISTVVTKQVAVPVAQPIAVPFEKHIAVPVKVPYAVPVDRPYPVHVPKPYPVHVTKHVAVPVDRPYPVPYAVKVPQPYPVPVVKHVPVAVSHPVVVEKYSSGLGSYAYSSSW